MKRTIIFLLICLLLLSITACGQPSSGQTEVSTLITPDPNKTDEENLVEGNNTFALNLYQSLKESPGNIFYSPYSISSALAMTYAGARGETEKQMAETLHYTLPQDRLHPAFSSISTQINSRGNESNDSDMQGFRLRNVNALWGQKGYQFLPDFIEALFENYGAGLRTLDFAGMPEESRIIINDWVSEQTETRIKDLVPAGSIGPLTRLILTNAIYFKAAWFYQFAENRTTTGTFHLTDGGSVEVPMMKLSEHLNYTAGRDYQALELYYRGRTVSMVILLPKAGQFESFEKSLGYSKLKDITHDLSLNNQEVNLTMPKFKFTLDFKLSKTLKDMGMPLAFSGGADFSGISEESELGIDEVCHKAFVAVDEEGTEAAAATAVIMVGAAPGQPEPVDFTMDRPFIFLIQDVGTHSILFMGRVLNPLESGQL